MARQQQKTKYIECELNEVRVTADAALIVGTTALGLSIGSIGLQFFGNFAKPMSMTSEGIQFPEKAGETNASRIGGFFKGLLSKLHSLIKGGGGYAQIPTLHSEILALRTDISPVIAWCGEEHAAFSDDAFSKDIENPEEVSLTAAASFELCNEFRDSLKPAFLRLARRINEMEGEIDSINDTYATVDEVNEVLTNYVQTKDLPAPVDLSGYVLKSELPTDYVSNSSLTTKLNDYALKNDLPAPVDLSGYVLKSDFDALKIENENLKAEIAALKPKYPWQEFYKGFDERVEFEELDDISKYIYWVVSRDENNNDWLSVLVETGEHNCEYLLIFNDSNMTRHCVRYDTVNNKAYINEIGGPNSLIETEIVDDHQADFDVWYDFETYTYDRNYPFDYVFKKKVA